MHAVKLHTRATGAHAAAEKNSKTPKTELQIQLLVSPTDEIKLRISSGRGGKMFPYRWPLLPTFFSESRESWRVLPCDPLPLPIPHQLSPLSYLYFLNYRSLDLGVAAAGPCPGWFHPRACAFLLHVRPQSR
jgi:hypothetical protein